MLQFFETTTACYEEIAQLSPATLRKLVGVRGKVKKLLGG